MKGNPHDLRAPSTWVTRWADRIRAGGKVLDVACGNGRHARFFAARGHPVEAVDRDPDVLARLADAPGVTPLCADIEAGPWPFAPAGFDHPLLSFVDPRSRQKEIESSTPVVVEKS